LLNWLHPAIPLDPPPGWLVSLVYGLPPLIAVFAWHLFLQRVAHRRHPAPVPAGTVPAVPQPAGPDPDRDRDEDTGTAAIGGPIPTPATPVGRLSRPPTPTPARPGPTPPRPTVGTGGARDAGLLAQARAAAAKHEHTHGRPISRDALRRALRVSNQTAGMLLHTLRADPADPDRRPQDQDDHAADRAGEPEPADPGQRPERGPAAGNGAGGRPAGLVAMVPTVPVLEPAGDDREATSDA
jgi:hypothetical protein